MLGFPDKIQAAQWHLNFRSITNNCFSVSTCILFAKSCEPASRQNQKESQMGRIWFGGYGSVKAGG